MVRSIRMRLLIRHAPAIAIAALAASLLFTGLGRDYLWEDEGDTAVLAHNILREGIPVAWDGVSFMDADYGQRLKFGFVMVSHPWLQYYAAAASFALFGESPWAARLPFAIAGGATIILVYALTLILLRHRGTALTAAFLLTVSVQFLLYSRQARNYSFNALLTCLLVFQFQRLDSRWRAFAFAATGILLFHTHAIGLAAVASLGILTLVMPSLAGLRRWFWPAALAIFAYATPWLVISRTGYATSTVPLRTLSDLFARLLQFAAEYASVTPALGVAALLLVVWIQARRRRQAPLFAQPERHLLTAIAAVCVGEGALMAATHTPPDMWLLGLHHTPALIPLTIVAAAILISRASAGTRTAWVALVLLFGFTRVAHLAPWASWSDRTMPTAADADVRVHVPDRLADRVLRTTQLQFVRSLNRPNDGVIAEISGYLRANAKRDDVVITNYAWEALYFHTRLPQGAKISKSFPIYPVARASKLPPYVFGADRVRWIVWRRAWPAYFPEQDCGELLERLRLAGVTTTLVASIPETLFENRENIHFRRYPGNEYVFPWYPAMPNAEIYRVDWDSDLERRHQRADALLQQGDYRRALDDYSAYLQERPDDVDAWSRLGVAAIGAGQIDAGLNAFRRAVALAPANGATHRNLAIALFDAGRIPEALKHAREAVALRPEDPDAYDLLGRALAIQEAATAVRRP
jgi:4-amino-4-deoxy-L-arabinose transferase-like glycosyltransferase